MRLLYIALYFTSLAAAQPSRDIAWRQDLDQLATQLPQLHPNLFYYSPRETFDREVASLREAIPSLPDSDVLIRMAAIVALAHDGHTSLPLSQRPGWFRMLPLSFQWFEDGLFVTGTSAEYTRAAGAKVLRIGNRTADEAYEAVKRILSYDTEMWPREISPPYLANADVLRALGVAPSSESVRFELQGRDGVAFTLDVGALERGQAASIQAYPAPESYLPLYRQNANQNYWFTYIESSRTLYFAYNRCQEMAGLPFARFNDQLWATFDSHPVERLVMDVRNNPGGSSAVIQPFLQSGQARAARLVAIRTALLTGRRTFSSGTLATVALHVGPVISYGEPTGGSPTGYGEVLTLTLTNYGTAVGYSTRYIQAGVPPGSIAPDVPVPIYSWDYFARHDPFLAAAMADAARPLGGGTIAVVNAASFRGPVAPGSLASAFGDWGEGAAVSVDGTAARVMGSFGGQVNFQVPESARPGIVAARIGGVEGTMRVVDAAPGLFAAIARDGYVEIYGTGQGAGQTPRVYVGNDLVETLYSGAHPAFPGLWQVNARLPEAGAGGAPVFVTLGGAASNGVTVRLGY